MSGLSEQGRAALVRAGGSTLLGETMPILANYSAVKAAQAGLELDQAANAFLSVVRDWWGLRPRSVARLLVDLERANVAIVEKHKAAAEQKPGGRAPTRMSKTKRTHAGGRR